jgi:hypothetical protein
MLLRRGRRGRYRPCDRPGPPQRAGRKVRFRQRPRLIHLRFVSPEQPGRLRWRSYSRPTWRLIMGQPLLSKSKQGLATLLHGAMPAGQAQLHVVNYFLSTR